MNARLILRKATLDDTEKLTDLITRSTLTLQSPYYTDRQLEGALGSAFGVDTQIIMDNTYFVVVAEEERLVGCGGWSKRNRLFGSDALSDTGALLDPKKEPARIRAFFIDPDYARKGIGTLLLRSCESEAGAAGFSRLELAATLAGVPLYAKQGFVEMEEFAFPLPNGETLPLIRMSKDIP